MKKLKPKDHDVHVFVCHGSKCSKKGAPQLRGSLRSSFRDQGYKARISRTTCQGQCKHGCVVFVEGKKAKWWAEVETTDADRLVKKVIKHSAKQAN